MTDDRSSLLIRGGQVLQNGKLAVCDLLIAGGRIAATGAGLASGRVLDVAGACVLPGLIDLHTHGLGFESIASPSLEDYARLAAAHGATTFFPTLFAPPDATIGHLRRHVRDCMAGPAGAGRAGARVGGFRLESPYLAHAGGGHSRDLAAIDDALTDALLAAGQGQIKIWDVSPELPGAPELIRRLASAGIVCSLAHTHATIEQARAAVDAGARLVTHLFDTFVLPEVTEPGAYPAGLVDYLLVEDRLVCEIIADSTHVHPLLIEKALRCKTAARLAWVTDSNFGAGLPPGEYEAPGWGWIVVDGPNQGVRLRDRGRVLAGSALTPIDGLRNAVRLCHLDLATASRLCSATPSALMGLNAGEIRPGRAADLIVLDADLELMYTFVAGEIVYEQGAGRG